MASEETDDQAVVFGDEFVADEILARLPARYAARCTVLSKRFQQLVRSQHFWLRQYRLGTPLELPHAARLQHHRDRNRNVFYIEFHVVGPRFVIEHAVTVEDYTTYAGTCNGLVLVSLFSFSNICDGVVFNPVTKEETRLSLVLPHPGKENVFHEIMGFGFGPSTKVYKALIREWVFQDSMRLMVVSLDGSGGQEPRTVFSSNNVMECRDSLHMTDGKVYFLMSAMEFNYERSVLAFDVDTESMIRIATPEGQSISLSMLELQGRPCIYTQKGQDTVISGYSMWTTGGSSYTIWSRKALSGTIICWAHGTVEMAFSSPSIALAVPSCTTFRKLQGKTKKAVAAAPGWPLSAR